MGGWQANEFRVGAFDRCRNYDGNTGSGISRSRKSAEPDRRCCLFPVSTKDRNGRRSRDTPKAKQDEAGEEKEKEEEEDEKELRQKKAAAEEEEEKQLRMEEEEWNKERADNNRIVGLDNHSGDNNCFLNSVIQILWHLDSFRKNFLLVNGHACHENSCIFCALKVTFLQFQSVEDGCPSIRADALRQSMSVAFFGESRFQLGEMEDAAECFEKILTRIHYHLTGTEESESEPCGQLHCIKHRRFSTEVVEEMVCSCGSFFDRQNFSQTVSYFFISSIMSLRREGRRGNEANSNADVSSSERSQRSFGRTIRDSMDGSWGRRCSKVGCGGQVRLRRTLVRPAPEVMSIGLVWDTENPSAYEIEAFLNIVDTSLLQQDLFDDVIDSSSGNFPPKTMAEKKKNREMEEIGVFNLTAIVSYYGRHYSTFIVDRRTNEDWIFVEDSQISEVGRWSDVIEKCVQSSRQPLLLIYAQDHCRPLDRRKAPRDTWRPTVTTLQPRTISADGGNRTVSRPASARPPKKTNQ